MVDDGDWISGADFAGEPQSIIKRAFNRQDFGPMNERLRELAEGDIGVWEQHNAV